MNRHYVKTADPARIATLLVPHLRDAGLLAADASGGGDLAPFLLACVPLVAGTVDTLADAPERLRPVFETPRPSATVEHLAGEAAEAAEAGRQVVVAFAQELSGRPRLTRETFREAAQQVRQRTGQKGRALFHPIRLALTGADSGPELDLLVPAIEAGAQAPGHVGLAPIVGCRERAAICAAALVGA
jgi:glutamyl/glutaminyl-tRNA synthetase